MSSSSPQHAPPFSLPIQHSAQQLMHKNRLQEFAQKSNIALPVYETINEGQQHAPKFRSRVWVDGMCYTSQSTFSHLKTAEQDAARLALKCLSKRTQDEAPSLVYEISTFCKSMLNEYATKLNLEGPTYQTIQRKGFLPVFKSSVVFNGTSYTGDAAGNKKDAEQLAARAAILSILDNADSESILFEMIRSKSKLCNSNKGKGLQGIHPSALTPPAKTGHSSEVELIRCKEFQIPKDSKQELSPQATKVLNVSLQRCSARPPLDGCSSLKRQRRN